MKTQTSNGRTPRPKTVAGRLRTACATRLLPLLLLLTLPEAVQAQLYWTTNNSTITITAFDSAYGGAVTIPDEINGLPVVSIGRGAFYNCAWVESVTIGTNVISIGDNAFEDCGLKSVTIPNSVTSIGTNAFFFSSLTSVTIPNSVTNIEFEAFDGSELANVTIGSGVTSIGVYAFSYCLSLTEITVGTSNSFFSSVDGVLFNKSQTRLIRYPEAMGGAYMIPDSVTCIGDNAFNDCSSLTSVRIPDGVTNIEGYAFASCTSLTNVTIPNSVITIGNEAFWSCTSLTNATIGNAVTSIGDNAFEDCSSLTSLTIGNSVASIGNVAFRGCISLASITIPNGVTSIGTNAFSWCASLTSVTIPNSVTNLGDSAFAFCSSLTSVTIPNSIDNVGSQAFCCSALSNVTIPNSVTNIGDEAFWNCTSLASVSIPNSVTSIGTNAFSRCTNLTSVTIPGSVTSIRAAAFYSCTSLTNVTIGNGVAGIGAGAFEYCSRLTSVTIPNSVTSIGGGAFYSCANLTNACFEGNAPIDGGGIFASDSALPVVNYVNGAVGWGATFSDIPTAPCAQCGGGGVGSLRVTINPSGAVSSGAQWQVDSGAWQSSGATVSGLSVSNHTVSFKPIAGWIAPGNQVVAVSLSTMSTVSGTYTLPDLTIPTLAILSPTNGQRVLTSPWGAKGTAFDKAGVTNVGYLLNDGAWEFASTGNHWTNWSINIAPVPGTNSLSVYATDSSGNSSLFKLVSFFYVVPAPLQLQITGKGTLTPNYTNGQLLELGRTYSITAAGTAGYVLDGWTRSNYWSVPQTRFDANPVLKFMMDSNLTLLANFKDVTKPTLAITNLVNYQQVGSPSLFIKGWAKDNAQVTNVQCRVGNGGWFSANGTTAWSTAFLGLLPGQTNTVNAYAQDSSGLCSLTSVVKVVYNQFLPVNGTYNGLFSASDSVSARMHESSGFLKLTVSGKGAYSGSFILAGKTNSLGTGTFDVNGHASKNVGTGANMVAVNLDLSLVPGSDTLTGTLSNSAWVAELQADRTTFVTTNKAPYAGKYTLVFPGAADEGDTATPFGVGYGAVTVSSLGQVALSGSLADGTALSQGTTVSKNGWWPMYASLNGGKGSIWGWLQFTNSLPPDLLGGEVSWIKELQPATMTKYYRLGFTNVLETQGSLYVTPTNATTHVIAVTNGVVSFAGGYPGVAFENLVLLTNKSVVVDQSKTNKLTMTMGLANGTFSGTVLVPGINKTRTFKGAVLQNENVNVGLGYFLGTNLSGRVYFGP